MIIEFWLLSLSLFHNKKEKNICDNLLNISQLYCSQLKGGKKDVEQPPAHGAQDKR